MDNKDLERGFVKAFNMLIADVQNQSRWEKMKDGGTPLQRIRAEQMIEISAEGETDTFIPELAQLATIEMTVHGAREFTFEFMDGSRTRVTV